MRAAAKRDDISDAGQARHRVPPADRRGGRQRAARAVLEVARRRGKDHDHALRHVRGARGGRGAARAAPRRDPVADSRRRPVARPGSTSRRSPASRATARGARGSRSADDTIDRCRARGALPRCAGAAPAGRRRRSADRATSRTTSTRPTPSSGCSARSPSSAWASSRPSPHISRPASERDARDDRRLRSVLRGQRALGARWLVVLLTVPVGIGMGVGNALAPRVVATRTPGDRDRRSYALRRLPFTWAEIAAALGLALSTVLGGRWRALGAWAALGAPWWSAARRARALAPAAARRTSTSWRSARILAAPAGASSAMGSALRERLAYRRGGWRAHDLGRSCSRHEPHGASPRRSPSRRPLSGSRGGGRLSMAHGDERRALVARRVPAAISERLIGGIAQAACVAPRDDAPARSRGRQTGSPPRRAHARARLLHRGRLALSFSAVVRRPHRLDRRPCSRSCSAASSPGSSTPCSGSAAGLRSRDGRRPRSGPPADPPRAQATPAAGFRFCGTRSRS